MISLYILSGMPTDRFPKPNIFGQDKIAHFILFSLGGLSAGFAFRSPATAFFAAMCFGIFDEWRQQLTPWRLSEFDDWIADIIGALTGALIYAWWRVRPLLRKSCGCCCSKDQPEACGDHQSEGGMPVEASK